MPLDLHTDHIGSLLRPEALLGAREAHDQGRLSDEALRAEEDRAILDALEMQRQSGIGICTDGEFRRMSWMSGMVPPEAALAPSGGHAPRASSRAPSRG